MNREKIGFIGAGNMAQAIIGGLIQSGLESDRVFVADLDQDKCDALARQYGITVAPDNMTVVEQVDVVVLAVKPQVMSQVLEPLAEVVQNSQPLIVSVAAGIPIDLIQSWVGIAAAVVRVMPNTPALVSAGVSGLYASDEVSDAQCQSAESIMRAVGSVIWVDNEGLIDSVTAVSGSGPAYFFYLIESLEQGGINNGLSPQQARLLALETAFGAAKLALESELSPAELRQRVTSPGGTTEAAINHMKANKFPEIVNDAVSAATKRAQTLADLARDN